MIYLFNELTDDIKRDRARILRKHLGCTYDEAYKLLEDEDYLLLTNDEANHAMAHWIADSIWAFRPSFLSAYTDGKISTKVFEALTPLCESANDAIFAMITGVHYADAILDANYLYNKVEDFMEFWIEHDRDNHNVNARGNALASYDSEEVDLGGGYRLYRHN